MGKIVEIGICKNSGDQIFSIKEAELVMGGGLIEDRHFKVNNNIKSQITLIEIENINYFNKLIGKNIPAIDYRRNIITQNISLNTLVGKEFRIGNIKVKANDLCKPCKYLQDKLNQKNFIKELLFKGGIRCEILSSGKINVGDIIKY
jgi:MOSC domain-containing protein YiiM